ncbi:Ku protein [Achromobacter sp. GG226]|uniref:non-homologous end joining protein Ku n=1 Tax=Verticiella alkaliphila TaxID=2779529 RepID=UPI001C0B884F|nr:Ku protein [Verticiella sp. GG226]MBU4611324.1 Ku protein [Verticiella sp. GG226]
MPRVVWKGAISFGLVHVPIVLHPGARRANLDFDWVDKRDMAPVGYQRINKVTGKTIESEHIAKGYQYEKGEYVLMSDEDFRQANPTATQTVEIVCFVKAEELPPYYFETPYYMVPDKRGTKGYVLLRETLRKADRIGIANVILHTKQHLAAVMVVDDMLVLNTMRYADEIIARDDLDVPAGNLDKAGISSREADMARRLVDDMTEAWEPSQFRDAYREDLLARIEEKIDAGQTHTLTEPSRDAPSTRSSAKVIDLVSMLKQSIESRTGRKSAANDDEEATPRRGRKASASDDADATPVRKRATKAAGKSAGKSTARKTATKTAAKAAGRRAAKRPAKTASERAAPAKRPAKTTAPRRRAA